MQKTMPKTMRRTMRRAVLAYSRRNRRRKAATIQEFIRTNQLKTSILVGCSPGRNPNEGIVEHAVAACTEVEMTCDVLPCETPWPFMIADGRDLPFEDQSTDFILANAVIEHVGDEADQQRFVLEQTRVARAWAITTPNRWFPIESHTSTLLRHWSPRWRAGRREFTRLLSRREFVDLLPEGSVITGRPWSPTFTALYVRPEGR
jgi:trans-aconitate methyltransferase